MPVPAPTPAGEICCRTLSWTRGTSRASVPQGTQQHQQHGKRCATMAHRRRVAQTDTFPDGCTRTPPSLTIRGPKCLRGRKATTATAVPLWCAPPSSRGGLFPRATHAACLVHAPAMGRALTHPNPLPTYSTAKPSPEAFPWRLRARGYSLSVSYRRHLWAARR